MKKITLLMMTLICSVVSMAQSVKITKVSDPTAEPQSGKVYAIMCNAQHDNITTWMYDDGSAPKATEGTVATDEIVETKYLWKITPSGEAGVYTVQNYATSQYISIEGTSNGGSVKTTADEKTVIISVGEGEGAGYIALKHMTTDQWIDMGWNGTGVETWSGDVSGSRRMQICEVDYELVGEMAVALGNLRSTFSSYMSNHDPELAKQNVGSACGNYGEEAVTAYYEKMEYAGAVLDADGGDLSIADINKLAEEIGTTWTAVENSRVPYAQQIAPGYYVIKSALDFYTTTTTEESEDPETGETIPSQTIKNHIDKAIYADKTAAKWKTYEDKADFLFKITETDTPLSYLITNQLTGQAFSAVGTLADEGVGMSFDLSKQEVEMWEGGKKVSPVYNIRLTSAAERDYNYVHAGGHSSGAGVSGNIVNWNHEDESVNASDWYIVQIDETTAKAWIEAASPTKKIGAMIDSINAIKTAFAEQKTIATDVVVAVDEENPLIKDASQFSSAMTESSEGSTANLLDGSASTFWHSQWSGSREPGNGVDFIQVADIDAASVAFVMSRRSGADSDHITQMSVYGFDTDNLDLTKEDGTLLAELSLPFGSNTDVITSDVINTQGKNILRFYSEMTTSSSSGNRGYWHMGEFQLYPATKTVGATITQATVRAAEMKAVEDAIAAWNEGAYTIENVSSPEDAAFVAAYNKVLDANAAWTKVYADPAEMREAVAEAKAYAKGMVEGKNPGQWPVGAGASVITKATDAAETYNNAGAYTAEGVAAQIKAVNDAKASVAAAAIQVQEGKWYNIRFATEAEYEAYGWDKTGAVSTTEGDLYGNLVAPATVEAGEPKTQPIVEADKIRKGAQLRFTEMANKSDAAIRFVKADNDHYFIQHVSGWYVGSNGQLGNTPALFSTNAIGYGKSLIKVQSLNGEDIDAGGTPSYLHAQVAGHNLVSWAADAIDSRSALYIEEIDAQTIESVCKENAVPGTIKFLTSPVELTYDAKSDATLYTFDGYEKTGNGVKVAFTKTAKAEAGKAVLMVVEGDYDSEAEAITLDLTLGTAFAAVPDSTQALVGTYQYQWVEAADTLHTVTIFGNKMQMATGADATDCSRDISAYTGAINLNKAAEISTAGKDLVITIAGDVDVTAIQQVIAKATSTYGKIYTIDGKYIGNGNIATARKHGAGLYIINGVKVAVK